MLSTKERAQLAAQAQKLSAIFQVGKNGLDGNIISAIDAALNARELIKITVLNNADIDARTVLNELCTTLNAEPIAQIGFKIVIYRKAQ